MSPPAAIESFIAKWTASGGSERANYVSVTATAPKPWPTTMPGSVEEVLVTLVVPEGSRGD